MKYYIIAGEPSGDKHGAKIIQQLKLKDQKATFQFWGGDAMEKMCHHSPFIHVRDMAFMGFIEVAKNLFTILRFFSLAKKDISLFQPDVVLFIDYPGFNLRMAKWAKLQGFKTIFYISPTVWAWHKSRVYAIEKYVDLMICILPFEIDFYKDYKVNAVYCGNPLIDEVKAFVKEENFCQKYFIEKPIVALLPGSRIQEIDLILPEMLKAAQPFAQEWQIIIAKADNISTSVYAKHLQAPAYVSYKIIENNYHSILSFAKIAVVTSGTATLETAIFGVPQVVCYKTSPTSYAIAKRLVTLKYISLVNLIAGKALVKELIQHDCNAHSISEEINYLKFKNKSMYDELNDKLGSEGSAVRIADVILQFLSQEK
jgi:lipid-A-disaccharide synthase